MIPTIPTSRRHRPSPQPGFTLVELLVVIMIIGILASLSTFALWDAQTAAREARTRTQIQKIHELLMIRWESYQTRPVPIRTSRMQPELAAKARLNALHELMRMEMPDRKSDVEDDPLFIRRPALNRAYDRRVQVVGGYANWSPTNQQAECLYMIVASIQDGTRNGLDFFRQSEIGDTDGDGMLEILDGWGQPIRFLRWAPGYVSDLQNRADLQPDPFDPLRVDARWKNNNSSSSERHFPDGQSPPYPEPSSGSYDPNLDDPVQLFPLVFSAGADGLYHVVLDQYDLGAVTNGLLRDDDYALNGEYNDSAALHYVNTHLPAYRDYTPPIPTYPPPPWPTRDVDPSSAVFRLWTSSPRNDPYVILPGAEVPPFLGGNGVGVTIGVRYGEGANDNIDNQSLLVR